MTCNNYQRGIFLVQLVSLFFAAAQGQAPSRVSDQAIIYIHEGLDFELNTTLNSYTLLLNYGESALIDFSGVYSIGGPNTTLTWIYNNENPVINSSLGLNNTITNWNGTITSIQLLMSNTYGNLTSTKILIQLLPSPQFAQGLPESIVVMEGDTLNLNVVVGPPKRVKISWMLNNTTIGDGSQFQIVPTLDIDGAEIQVVATDVAGVTVSKAFLRVTLAHWKIVWISVCSGVAGASLIAILIEITYYRKRRHSKYPPLLN